MTSANFPAYYLGLPKREIGAFLIMQGLISPGMVVNLAPGDKVKIIKRAIEFTDDLLKELDNTSAKK